MEGNERQWVIVMDWSNLLKKIVEEVGVIGFKRAEDALKKLEKQADSPWKKAIMNMLADAVEEHGWEGVRMVQDAIEDMHNGKSPDMNFASLRAHSDALAVLQNMEADEKSKVKDFFSVVGESLGIIIKMIIKGLLK